MNIRVFVIIFFIIFSIFLLFFSISLSNKFLNNYSWTKAICNKTHCQDYEIVCDGKEIVSAIHITGATIILSEDWKDPRKNNEKEEFCIGSNIFKSYFIN